MLFALASLGRQIATDAEHLELFLNTRDPSLCVALALSEHLASTPTLDAVAEALGLPAGYSQAELVEALQAVLADLQADEADEADPMAPGADPVPTSTALARRALSRVASCPLSDHDRALMADMSEAQASRFVALRASKFRQQQELKAVRAANRRRVTRKGSR